MNKPHLILALSLLTAIAAAAAQPNVIVILTDDQGWGDLSVNGNTNLQTPNIDSLARDGASFERFFVCPVCSPTRAEFLTGRYHMRGGVYSTSTGGERLDLDERTIAEAFQAAGYVTAAFGKWHNGSQFPYHPNARGFQEYYGFTSGHWGDYFSPMLDHNGKLATGSGFIIDDFTNHALQFIREHQSRPFFLYLPFNTPHSPMQVPDEYWNRFKDKELNLRATEPAKEDLQHTRAALAMCENIDWNTGRILALLEELKLAENTLVLYFCDNGPNGKRWNGGMRGTKASTDEGGVRSPLLMRWPGQIPAGRKVSRIAGAIDLLPTLTELAGIPRVGDKPLDGRSLKPLLVGEGAANWEDRVIYSTWNKKFSARNQQYRLDTEGRLYDMIADPGQLKNVAAEHPDIAESLRQGVEKWRTEMAAELGADTRPFLIGYPGAPATQIPARDGIPGGEIQRSAKAPNCSYFTNWVNVNDSITWPAEAAAAGDYEVEIYYACPAADVGSTIEMKFNDSVLRGKVSEPNDPPLRGEAQDRVFRNHESYVKDFKPMKLGTLHLEKGPGILELRAIDKPGAQVMEVRLVVLTPVSR